MTTLRNISAAIVLLLIPALSAHINAQDIKPDFAVGTPLPEGLFNPTAPDVSAMMRYGGRTGTSLYTGAAHLSIPVFDYEDADISLPISMEYDCNGYKPGVTASTLGYGWTLSAGGAITREVHGLPDEVRQREYGARNTGDNSAIEDLIHTAELSMVDAGTTRHLVQTYMKGQTVLIDGYASRYASDMALGGTDFAYSGELGREYVLYRKYDGQTRMGVEEEPDTYHFQFPGHSGSFTLGDNGQVVILESSTPAGELAISMHYNRNEPGTSSFTITTGEGTKYYFEYRDNCHAALDGADDDGFTVIYARVPSPSMDRNWILTERLSGSQSKAYSIDYFDGVGNLVQSQEVFASEDGGADLITAHSFDHLFRETRTYSPYPLPDNYGAFDPSAEARQEAFYKGLYPQESGNGAYAWTETAHDAAPGGRVTSLTRPGKVYHEVGRSLRTAYRGNRAGEVLIVDVGVSDGALSIPGYYLQGSLACVSATDEDGRRKDTFTDLDGNVVLERRFPVEGDSTLVADTYYGYDVMGRLTGAEQFDGTVKTNAHTERDIAYDLNSAILSMKRSNGSAAQTFSRSYDGVRRSGLDYDANGNVTRDPGNRFSASYNILNLPETVRAEGYLDCEIVYLADGTKIRAIETQDMQAGYYYAGPFRMSYSDGAIDLESAAFSGGRFDFSGTPHYFLSDHLGSVRAIVDADGEAEAAYDYLPYGGLWSSSGTDYDNDFLFGGKERQTVLGLDLYDNAARFLSTDGSFISIDPRASRYPSRQPLRLLRLRPGQSN